MCLGSGKLGGLILSGLNPLLLSFQQLHVKQVLVDRKMFSYRWSFCEFLKDLFELKSESLRAMANGKLNTYFTREAIKMICFGRWEGK